MNRTRWCFGVLPVKKLGWERSRSGRDQPGLSTDLIEVHLSARRAMIHRERLKILSELIPPSKKESCASNITPDTEANLPCIRHG